MDTTPETSRNDREMERLLSRFGEPFARALAVFVEELSRSNALASGVSASDPSAAGYVQENLPGSWDELPGELRTELEAEIRSNNEGLATGELEAMPFTADSPRVAAANRLRQVAESKGITQKELARRLEVSPSVISKVFKEPDRSTLRTLKRIANALGVDVHAIIE
jgi:DNA-binding XRE family transcriptional regulator